MCYMCGQSSHQKFICIACRTVNGACTHAKIVASYRWRPPKKNNHKAWKKIAAGDIWWDKRAIESKGVKTRLKHAAYVLYWTRERRAEAKALRKKRQEEYLEELRRESAL
jgi:hypothetical protein